MGRGSGIARAMPDRDPPRLPIQLFPHRQHPKLIREQVRMEANDLADFIANVNINWSTHD